MRNRITYPAIALVALAATAHAHEPLSLRLIREYHREEARIRAEDDSRRERFGRWEKDWRRQEQARRDALKQSGRR